MKDGVQKQLWSATERETVGHKELENSGNPQNEWDALSFPWLDKRHFL